MNGDPPNGGLPSGTVFYTVPASPAPASSSPPIYYVPAYYAYADPRMWLPPQQEPPSPPPSPPPAPAPILSQWTPPGAAFLDQPAPSNDGVQLLYSKHHTVFHVIWDRNMELDRPTANPVFEAKMFPTGLTVKELIQQLGAPDDNDAKYGVMEVHELGDGRWAAGQIILLDSPNAAKPLKEIGWDERRGFSIKPVWIKVHTV
ncbi:MAG: hypothetical protein LQ352_000047 [Teloschistes flavicans]|nr:MAG: hypothetical protein LQ352_000047 [Teloschistes flavicans]